MARSFQINGPTMVMVKGNGALNLSGQPPFYASSPFYGYGQLSQLGLAADNVTVTPRYVNRDISVTDFGPNVPAEVMWMLSDVTIRMNLVHYDKAVLDGCTAESMAGGMGLLNIPFALEGYMAPAGSLMGNGLPLLSSGNHYISLNLLSPVLGAPWRFPASYLSDPPFSMPLGTKITPVPLTWRAIPYVPPSTGGGYSQSVSGLAGGLTGVGDILSSGVPLWYRTLDTI